MKKKRDRRRGIAIEMAIGTMLIMVALSILLTTLGMIQVSRRSSDLQAFEKKITGFAKEDNASLVLDGVEIVVSE